MYENILDEFSLGHCGIKVKVTIELAISPADGTSLQTVIPVIAKAPIIYLM